MIIAPEYRFAALLWAGVALGCILLACGGCGSLRSTNEFGSGEHQADPLLDAAAQAWQAKQR